MSGADCKTEMLSDFVVGKEDLIPVQREDDDSHAEEEEVQKEISEGYVITENTNSILKKHPVPGLGNAQDVLPACAVTRVQEENGEDKEDIEGKGAQINQEAKLTAAIKLVEDHGLKDFNTAEVEKACGVGVEVSQCKVEEAVAQVIRKHIEKQVEQEETIFRPS
ncbi:hypothetical protein Pmani_014713 [Petrolisthes manimaculis]|uniref:Glutaminyl-tRNA synthetase class Ib non-specific RNA-binding domain-containing protein n=1 Tax=Petrolisthes manimaculis TaxID=1843537 RepID=A0AAE1UAP2_9EUCA|nr:hypothetical protein Pmani_014713 [Petrolisthes manimaculis]